MQQNIAENITLVDWFSASFKDITVDDLKSYLGLDSVAWVSGKGLHGYSSSIFFESIRICFAGRPEMGIWLEMSGQGCRSFETYGSLDWTQLFRFSLNYGHITRIDIAYDDHTGILPIKKIISDTKLGNFRSPFRYWGVTESSKGSSLEIGSPKSDVRVRIYDKARERGFEDDSMHWIRVEMQLRDKLATTYVSEVTDRPELFGWIYKGIIHNYLSYVTPNLSDSNKSRWDLRPYWDRFLDDVSAIKIYTKPGVEYNLYKCEQFVYKQAGNAIECLMSIYGADNFIDKLFSRDRSGPLPDKYLQLISTNK